MRKLVFLAVIVAAVLGTTLPVVAETTDEHCTLIEGPPGPRGVRGPNGPPGPPGPAGPVSSIPEWYLWLAVAGAGLGFLGTGIAIVAVASNRGPTVVVPPVNIFNNVPGQGH